jgi:hypothetical protein
MNQFTLADLYDFIKESFGIKEIPLTMIRQINRFSLDYNMSAKDIARCICYFQEVRNGILDPLYGIWFVPNIREQAAEYFKKLELDQQKRATEAKKVAEYQDNNIIFNIKSLQHKRRQPKQLDITTVRIKGEDND